MGTMGEAGDRDTAITPRSFQQLCHWQSRENLSESFAEVI